MKRTTIRLDKHLLAQTRKYAARHHRALTSVIEDALRNMLSESQARQKVRAWRIEIFTYGKGGTLPGVPPLDCYGKLIDYMEERLPLEKRR